MLIVEAEIARKRKNDNTKTLVTLMQSALASVQSKKAAAKLTKTLTEME